MVIRFSTLTGILTGWAKGIDSNVILAGEDEELAIIPGDTFPSDDYEDFRFKDGTLTPSGKRNIVKELDELKAAFEAKEVIS